MMPAIGGGRRFTYNPKDTGPWACRDATVMLRRCLDHFGKRVDSLVIVGKGPSLLRTDWSKLETTSGLPPVCISLHEAVTWTPYPTFALLVDETAARRTWPIAREKSAHPIILDTIDRPGWECAWKIRRDDPAWAAGFLHAGSGGIAIVAASLLGASRVYLVGFDAFWTIDGKVEEAYAPDVEFFAGKRPAGGDYSAETHGVRLALAATGITAVRAPLLRG